MFNIVSLSEINTVQTGRENATELSNQCNTIAQEIDRNQIRGGERPGRLEADRKWTNSLEIGPKILTFL
jgi:hypothetical protein